MGLLNNVLKIQSSSQDSEKMQSFIRKELNAIAGVTCYSDTAGNIFATKGKVATANYYPAFACHTDTVHDIRKSYEVIRSPKHVWFAMTVENGKAKPTGVGGDDKCGIYLCIKLLQTLDTVKCVFFADEEIGCVGAERADLKFFDDCAWVIECDRKGKGDIITFGVQTNMCSIKFQNDLDRVGAAFGYKHTIGVYTDVTILKRDRNFKLNTANISVGYYESHSPQEYIVEKDLMNAFSFCMAIAKDIKYQETHYAKYQSEPSKKKSFPLLGDGGRPCNVILCNNRLNMGEYIICTECDEKRKLGLDRCATCHGPLNLKTEYADGECQSCSRDYEGDYASYHGV